MHKLQFESLLIYILAYVFPWIVIFDPFSPSNYEYTFWIECYYIINAYITSAQKHIFLGEVSLIIYRQTLRLSIVNKHVHWLTFLISIVAWFIYYAQLAYILSLDIDPKPVMIWAWIVHGQCEYKRTEKD